TSYGANDVRMPDLTTFYTAMPVTNYLRVDWMSNDKSTGARIEFGISAGIGHGAGAVGLRYMYGWYKFGRCRLVIGHTDNLLASLAYAPYQWLGLAALGSFTSGGAANFAAPVVLFIGHGKQYSGRFAQIALYYDVGPWTFMVAIGQAPTNNAGNPVGNAFAANTMWPRLDLAVKYKGKYIGLAPGISIYMSERESINGGNIVDDRILSYLVVLPFRISLGKFRIVGELSHGRNWVAANYFPGQTVWNRAVYWGGANDPARIKVEDTYFLAACLGLEYHLGRVSFHLGGGWHKSTNATEDVPGGWRHGQQVRFAFNFAVRYRVNKHFVIAPEVSYWYYGWDPTQDVGGGAMPGRIPLPARGSMFADFGSAWLAGISFQFRF
ncbi:MAG: hypothetical protein KJ621_10670, partial [Proteobacteria bacterium]|nr:hypothetical protein [Pseudomonadota bacterium]